MFCKAVLDFWQFFIKLDLISLTSIINNYFCVFLNLFLTTLSLAKGQTTMMIMMACNKLHSWAVFCTWLQRVIIINWCKPQMVTAQVFIYYYYYNLFFYQILTPQNLPQEHEQTYKHRLWRNHPTVFTEIKNDPHSGTSSSLQSCLFRRKRSDHNLLTSFLPQKTHITIWREKGLRDGVQKRLKLRRRRRRRKTWSSSTGHLRGLRAHSLSRLN